MLSSIDRCEPAHTVRQSASETDTPQGLHVEGTLLLQDPTALKAYTLIKARVISGMSIGYEALQSSMDADGVRLLKEVRLWEGSIVTFPMNESATISSVKSLSLSDDEVQMRR
jgi:HK97 family phage prohead protease